MDLLARAISQALIARLSRKVPEQNQLQQIRRGSCQKASLLGLLLSARRHLGLSKACEGGAEGIRMVGVGYCAYDRSVNPRTASTQRLSGRIFMHAWRPLPIELGVALMKFNDLTGYSHERVIDVP